jgi:non-ribosomal peptide synthetase component E (peptide arylation enzyme)
VCPDSLCKKDTGKTQRKLQRSCVLTKMGYCGCIQGMRQCLTKKVTATSQDGSRISLLEVCYTAIALSTGHLTILIIRIGGENIAPREIEERLVQHPAIAQAAVIGINDPKYGEVVGAFLQLRESQSKPSANSLQKFVRKALGWHKAPAHIFWLGEGESFPMTGSGKIKKHILKALGDEAIKKAMRISKL